MISKIRTQEDIARANRRKQLLLGAIMILLLVVSTAGYALLTGSHGEDGSSVEEHGLTFARGHGGWLTLIDGQEFGFRHLPSEVADVSVSGVFSLSDYGSDTVLYFTEANEAVSEVISNVGRFVLRYQEACIDASSCQTDAPLKTCIDHVIIWEPSNETRVYRDANCVYLQGDPTRAADAFLYKLLKVAG